MRETWFKGNFLIAVVLAICLWLWFLGWLIIRLVHAIAA
jgi:hypothetical protein